MRPFIHSVIAGVRLSHEFKEAIPQCRNGIIFFGHS